MSKEIGFADGEMAGESLDLVLGPDRGEQLPGADRGIGKLQLACGSGQTACEVRPAFRRKMQTDLVGERVAELAQQAVGQGLAHAGLGGGALIATSNACSSSSDRKDARSWIRTNPSS